MYLFGMGEEKDEQVEQTLFNICFAIYNRNMMPYH